MKDLLVTRPNVLCRSDSSRKLWVVLGDGVFAIRKKPRFEVFMLCCVS